MKRNHVINQRSCRTGTMFLPSLWAGILFFAAMPCSAAPLSPSDFKYCSDIAGPFKRGSLYQLYLSGDILENCAQGCLDARLLESENEIPWVLIEEHLPAEQPEVYPAEITGYKKEARSSTITLKLPEKHRAVSSLDLKIADRDFQKQVSLAGSNDEKTWQKLADDNIYDFTSQVELRKTKISFSKSDYRYYRLTLIDVVHDGIIERGISLKYQGMDFSVHEGKKDIRIVGIDARTTAADEEPALFDRKTINNFSKSADKDGNTVISFSTGLPVDQFSLEIENTYYYRTVLLYAGSEEKKDSYRLLGTHALYRFPLSGDRRESRNIIELPGSKQDFYKIVIVNKNNPPLAVKGVSAAWVRKNLYFIALSDGDRYSLCIGNRSLKGPEYDLARFLTRSSLRQHSYGQVSAAPLRENAGYIDSMPQDKKARAEKNVLVAVAAVLVAVMGFWLFSLMKKAGRNRE